MKRKIIYAACISLFVLLVVTAITASTSMSSLRADEEIFIEVKITPSDSLVSFMMDKNLVTVREYSEFVLYTGYVTEAERFKSAGVFDMASGTFVAVEGANFKFPFGPGGPEAEPNHPVTQVSWNDANAYARWKGKRLPTRLEWEFAAAGGNPAKSRYSWGDELVKNGKYKANTWQGNFPFHNTSEDGFAFTSPVGAFGANDFGLTDMGGNVWQWCNDVIEPAPWEKIVDSSPRRLLKGGSYLCDPLVCHGFRIFGESSSTPESSMAHIGFRCVRDIR